MTDHDAPTRSSDSGQRTTRPVFADEDTVPPAALAVETRRIGPYRILRHLGSGGMGTVYLAQQTQPIERTVALKVIQLQSAVDTASDLRFLAEQQALARLSHPNVAQLYDSGRTEDGQPFFAMEYVQGKTLTRFCDDRRLSVRERLEIFVQVCRGVEHAHQKGVLHRDIKPANVLVTDVDGEPLPKLIDFGIAKGIDRPLAEVASLTGDGVLGTLAYLSPEAVDGDVDRDDLDTRADVYALGILLHELLVGQRPFERSGESTAQVLRRILSSDLQSISQHVRSLDSEKRRRASWNRCQSAPGLARELMGDLEAVVSRATARERDDRYGSAGELAADVLRYLNHEPVLANAPGVVDRLLKWVRRHRLAFAAGTAVVLSLALGAAAATIGMLRARDEARAARAAQRESDEVVEFVTHLFLAANPDEGRPMDERVGNVLERGAERLEEELVDEPRVRSRLLQTIGGIYRRSGEYRNSKEQLEQALALRRTSGAQPLLIAESATELAQTLMELSDYETSRLLLEEAIEIRSLHLGAEDPLTLESRQALASALVIEGRLDEALVLQEETLELMELAHGPNAAKVGHAFAELGGLQIRLNDWQAARVSLDRAIEIFRREAGERHPLVGFLLVNRAGVDGTLDGPAAEEETLSSAVAVLEQSVDPAHLGLLAARYGLAGLRRTRGQFEEAEGMLAELVPAFAQSVGEEHVLSLQTLFTWGESLADLGRHDDAVATMQRAQDLHRELYPESYREYADRAAKLGRALVQSGDLGRAERVIVQALSDLDDRGEGRSFDAATLRNAEGHVAMARGDWARARELWLDALAIRRELDDGANAGNAQLLARIARTHEEEGDVAAALRLHEEAVATFEELSWLAWRDERQLAASRSRLTE